MSNSRSNHSRETLAVILLAVGVVAVIVGFVAQADANKKAAVNGLLGGSGSADKTSMWIAFGVAALCLLGALMAFLSRTAGSGDIRESRLTPGWYDDPDSPTMLRYWDGASWTDKTAQK